MAFKKYWRWASKRIALRQVTDFLQLIFSCIEDIAVLFALTIIATSNQDFGRLDQES